MYKRVTYKNKVVLTVCLVLMLLSVVLSIGSPSMAFADIFTASNVLDDLRQDESFDVGLYPSNSKDTGVYVIQIAESVDNELIIYTYQPCQRSYGLTATKINLSTSQTIDATKLYTLTLLSNQGVFSKYKVDDLVVSDKDTRYYNISTIYRKWLSGTDPEPGNDNTVSEIGFKVGVTWVAKTSGDTVRYSAYEEEVVTITAQDVGLRRYYKGFTWNSNKSIDAHYLVFSCDHSIDRLISATVDFYTQGWKHTVGQSKKYDDKVRHTVNLYDYQMGSTGQTGWFGDEETKWHRMNSTKSFVEEVGVTGDDRTNLLKYDWVLNFYETDIDCDFTGSDLAGSFFSFGYIIKGIYDACTTRGTEVSDVTLLRLEFEYDGEVYNLGVVSSSQTGSGKPSNTKEIFNLLKWLEEKTGIPKGVWIAGVVLVILSILMPILSAVFPAFGQVLKTVFKVLGNALQSFLKGLGIALKYFFKALWWLICLPFKGIKALITKIKDR